jgi:glyoxylase-like metal-dependent hydrolase (beta-lactamase superfamily II)
MAIRKTKPLSQRTTPANHPVKKPEAAKKPALVATLPVAAIAPPGSPKKFRARVRMYRQGLGDCFLMSFPRKHGAPFHMLIDCGALGRDKKAMTAVVEHIEKSIAPEGGGKSRLDLVIATHEHKDHLSGFNQARSVFNRMEFGAVWLSWLENLTEHEASELKKAKRPARAESQMLSSI